MRETVDEDPERQNLENRTALCSKIRTQPKLYDLSCEQEQGQADRSQNQEEVLKGPSVNEIEFSCAARAESTAGRENRSRQAAWNYP